MPAARFIPVPRPKLATLIGLVLALLMTMVMPLPGEAAPTGAERLKLTPAVGGLNSPVHLTAPSGDERLFVVELAGRIRVVENGVIKSSPFLDISGRVSSGSERGLFALEFHPDYSSNGLFYVYYTDNGGDVRVSEFEVTSNPNVADPGSERIIIEVAQPSSNHNGGGLAFGPSGYLYIALGDGGGSGDPGEHGQNPSTLLGSLLRLDIDDKAGGKEYAIPPSNPFVSGGGAPEVLAYGLRNPFRISADQVDGLIYIGDVGQDRREEINVISDSETSAVNFGWDVMEGSLCFEPSSGCNTSGKTLPILEYNNPSQGISVIGGYVYRGHAMPWLRGTYFYSDLAGRRLKSFRYSSGQAADKTDWTSQTGLIPSSVFSFGQDGLGELYVLAGGTAYRIDPARPGVCDFNGDGDDELAVGIPGEDVAGLIDAGALAVMPSRNQVPGPDRDQLWHQDDDGFKSVARDGEMLGSALACGDFDGDGYDDLAIGTPGDRHQGGPAGGAVNVLYGTPNGLTEIGDQLFHQNSAGIGGTPESGDLFGASLAAGDFNGDGYSDLAIGVPGEGVLGVSEAGMVHILDGSSSGLKGTGSLSWYQDTQGIRGKGEVGDHFGASLLSADFNGDGVFDLAIGVPDEDIDGAEDAGMVQVFRGRYGSGLTVSGDIVLEQNQPGIKDPAEAFDHFGASMAAGPINADGYDDLVVGIPGESVDGMIEAGMVQYFPGSKDGPNDYGDRLIHQGSPGIQGTVEADDGFGHSLAAGDVDGDGFTDIAVGTPFEDVNGIVDAGAVWIIFGGPTELTQRDQIWHQGSGILGTGELEDRFGENVTLLDFERDRRLDLVVGNPFEDVVNENDGDVAVLFGRSGGITASGNLRLSQATSGMQGSAEAGDHYAGSLGR